MLKLLLDEHISPAVAIGVGRRNRSIIIRHILEWQEGNFLGQDDAACLREADIQGFTFVTYERRTIPPLLKVWAEEGRRHASVIFVDEKTISPADIGRLVLALDSLAKETQNWDWANRVCFLRR